MKTLFHKWRSIENLDDFIAEDELKYAAPEARYIVTEKLDGSNLQIAWDWESDTLSFFTRNGNSPFETVKGFESFAPTTTDLAALARSFAAAHSEASAVGWYGELIGSKAMNRLCYCKELQVRLFHFYWEAGDVIHHSSFPELEAQLKDAGLLEKYGIKSESITSGPNKAMGSLTEPMTDQQREIWQSMVDEAYDQFVGIVADGRKLDESYVRSIADGRIYTARQAKANKLVDDVVNTYDDAVAQMQKECDLEDAEVYEFCYQPDESLFSSLVTSARKLAGAAGEKSDISALTKLMEKQEPIEPQYLCEERK